MFLAASLFASSAVAQSSDAPLLQPMSGGYFVSETGMTKLNTELAEYQRERAALRAENARLKQDIATAASRPALTWKSTLVLMVTGALLGGLGTFAVLKLTGAH